MATQADSLPTRILSGPASSPTVLVECRYDGARYFAQTTLPYTATECIADIIGGQHHDPMRVLLIDPNGTWQDISTQIAEALWRKALNEGLRLDGAARDFAEHHAGLRPALAA